MRGDREIRLHGRRVVYRQHGDGPVIVLLHGLAGSTHQWDPVVSPLAERFTVVMPELAGHGTSPARDDQSLGALACGIRDLLDALGHQRGTIVGHSLGGGIAMQFTYQFPERCDRLVLVSSGGLGREVNPLLRAATVPGSELVLPLVAHQRVVDVGRMLGRWATSIGLRPGPDLLESLRSYASLADADRRRAFIDTVRTVIDHRGQRVCATDRLYLAAQMPRLLVWGAGDKIIPVDHGRRAHRQMPGSRLEIFPDAGHFPHLAEPERFVRTVVSFIDGTEPAAKRPTAAAVTAVSP